MQPTSLDPAQRQADKRVAILKAALELASADGLHNMPTSAIARQAGVAAGTLYLYFESKEDLINQLYLEVASELARATMEGIDHEAPVPDEFRRAWFNRARWHLDNLAASNFMRQCEASAVLTHATLAAKAEVEKEANARFIAALTSGKLNPWPRQVHYALLEGPILVLAHLRDKGEIEITDEILEQTFQGVASAMLL